MNLFIQDHEIGQVMEEKRYQIKDGNAKILVSSKDLWKRRD
jgi:hypothetical protein